MVPLDLCQQSSPVDLIARPKGAEVVVPFAPLDLNNPAAASWRVVTSEDMIPVPMHRYILRQNAVDLLGFGCQFGARLATEAAPVVWLHISIGEEIEEICMPGGEIMYRVYLGVAAQRRKAW